MTPDSPAEAAGVETGDVILEFDGTVIPEMRDLPRVVAATKIGKSVDVVVLRKGREQTLEVTIAELEEGPAMVPAAVRDSPPAEAKALGMTLAVITAELRERYDLGAEAESARVRNAHHISDAFFQDLLGQGHVAHFGHAGKALGPAILRDHDAGFVDVQIRVVDARLVVVDVLEDDGAAAVFHELGRRRRA